MSDWIPVLVALVPVLGAMFGELRKARQSNDKARKLIFRAEIRDLYREYKARGHVSVEELAEFSELVDAYHAAGGNGTATRMAEEVEKLERRG